MKEPELTGNRGLKTMPALHVHKREIHERMRLITQGYDAQAIRILKNIDPARIEKIEDSLLEIERMIGIEEY